MRSNGTHTSGFTGRLLRGLALVAGTLVAGGCSENTYEHTAVPTSSAAAQTIADQLEQIHGAAPESVDTLADALGAGELTPPQREALTALFRMISEADKAELVDVDRFGKQVYRARLNLTIGEEQKQLAVLLVRKKGKTMWAGPN